MNPNIFREFSIRGAADQELTDDVVTIIGRAIGAFLKQRNMTTVVVGRDVRNSSPRISHSLSNGLLHGGIEVIDVGVVPTPVLNFATDLYQAPGGVMITASHNPPSHNGLKIRTDRTVGGDELQEIGRIALAEWSRSGGKVSSISSPGVQASQANPFPFYLERIKAQADMGSPSPLRSLKVVVDGGNGTNGLLVSQLLKDLDLKVVELQCEPNGDFPGRGPDPTASGAMETLSTLVKSHKADLGLAYDGDGDRLALVDEKGNRVLGDQIMMILARDILQHGPAKIIYEILCTQALADDVIAHGGEPIMTPSGYAFVHGAMLQTGGSMGGELSGHLFFNEPDFHFDDSILATVKLLNIVARRQRPLSGLIEALPAYYSSPQVRLPCPDSAKAQIVEYIRSHFENDYKVDTLDGARIHFPEGWAMVRQSNTQPVISMRFEARSPEQLEIIQSQVQSLVEAEINRRLNTYSGEVKTTHLD